MAIELNKDNFNEHISGKLALVDFWAPWCGPCMMMMPAIEELSNEIKDVKIGKLNIDENNELASQYGVNAIPTLALFKDGKALDIRVGAATKAGMKEWIEGYKK
ncbi:MAG: thioredoxin [Candidatus Micrarchaeota archaeon]